MPFWALSALCGLLLAGLAVLLWIRRPPAPLWPILFACQVFALVWVVGDLWATHARSLPVKQLALAVLFTGSIGLTVCWWESTRRYIVWLRVGRGWLERPAAAWLPACLALVGWAFAVTNFWHGQLLEPVIGARNEYHWGAAIVSYPAWALALLTSAACFAGSRRHPAAAVRRRLALLGAITLVPISTHLVHLLVPGLPREDTVAIGLGLTSAAVLYGIRRRRLFNLPPIAVTAFLRDRDAVLFLDRGGRLLTWNPGSEKLLESMLLEPEMPFLEALAPRLRHPEDESSLDGGELLAALTEDRDARPVFVYTGGGGDRWLRFSVTPVPRVGPTAAVALQIQDATRGGSFDRLEGVLPRREGPDESLALLAGGVGHDFNNLLTVIQGRVEIALDDAARGLPVRRHIVQIRKAATLAQDLNAELLRYAGQAAAQTVLLNVSDVVADVTDLLEELVPTNVELRTDLAHGLPPIVGDPTQLRQVVMNLVKNGAEAIGQDVGIVTVRTTSQQLDRETLYRSQLHERLRPGEHVVLEVVDSGCGMTGEASRRAFDSFFSTKAAGRGLGLGVVSGIVETHGGAIELDTEPGWGTTFRIWLPIAPGDGGRSTGRQ